MSDQWQKYDDWKTDPGPQYDDEICPECMEALDENGNCYECDDLGDCWECDQPIEKDRAYEVVFKEIKKHSICYIPEFWAFNTEIKEIKEVYRDISKRKKKFNEFLLPI